jgi:small-conductance mechanosensitive channel/CRP-like cAMP-binding protein
MTEWFEQSPTLAASFVSLCVLLALLGLGWLLRSRFKIRLSLFYNIFCLIVAAYVWLLLSHKYGLLKGWQLDLYLKVYIAVVIFFVVWFATKVFSAFFWDIYLFEHRKTQVPGLLRSIVTVLILSAAILLIVRFIFDRSLSGLLVASSVTVAVLIFALQDFLSGLIAGITISIEPPFGVGDWIMVGDKEGEVVDINWRATTLQTFDQTYLIIPNSIISKDQITNFYKPTKLHALHLFVGVEYGVPPSVVKETLIACALEGRGVLSIPKPISRLVNYGDFAITYEIKFFIENHSISQDVKDDIMTRIWYNLRRRGIKIPFPIRDVFVHEEIRKEAVEEMNLKRVEGFLRQVSIFEPLDNGDIKALASSGRDWSFGKGEHIVKQGEAGSSLFLILDGSASVHVRRSDNGADFVVGRLQAGDFFGEKSLLTGEPRGASVVAETDLEVIEIQKENLVSMLESNPRIMEELSRNLAERQLMNEGFFERERRAEEVAAMRTTYSARFLQSMKAFFRL